MAMLIQLVVRELHFFEGHHLLQQLLTREWGVWVHVQPEGHREKAGTSKPLPMVGGQAPPPHEAAKPV